MSSVKLAYQSAMEKLYIACVVLSGTALVVITLIVPFGVFMRYVMHKPVGWPEPAAVIMMVMFSFIGGAAVYRAQVHVAVEALVNAVKPGTREALRWAVRFCMTAIALFMLVWGAELCWIVRGSTVAEFPGVSQALVYSPIPIAGLFTLLFIIERVWVGEPPRSSYMFSDQATELE